MILGCIVASSAFFQDQLKAQTILDDYRATDTAVTPALGRGYSLSTNTYQSTCLTELTTTEASYDFSYDFFEISGASLDKAQSQRTLSGSANARRSSTTRFWKASQNSTKTGSVSADQDKTTSSLKKKTTRQLGATLVVSSYYATVNEAQSPLNKHALDLVERHDIPGFFAACGTYYVRGITREAQLNGLFTFEASSQKEAQEVIQAVKFLATNSSNTRVAISAGLGSKKLNLSHNKESSTSGTSELEQKQLDTINRSNLQIMVSGLGMGKYKDAKLVATSMKEFKSALKDAFKSMQTHSTGRVTSVELVNWAENLQFQSKLQMTGKDVVSGKVVPLYRKKDVLTFNGEFMAEMNRALRQKLTTYFLARDCRTKAASLKTQPGSSRKVLENRQTGKPGISIDDLQKQLTTKFVQKVIFEGEYLNYLNGSGGGSKDSGNYENCMHSLLTGNSKKNVTSDDSQTATISDAIDAQETNEVLREIAKRQNAIKEQSNRAGKGLYLKRWTSHPSCFKLQKKFPPPSIPFLQEYCLPTWSRGVTKI